MKYQEIGGRTASRYISGFQFSLYFDGAHRIETVVGQARVRLRLHVERV